MYSAKHSSLCHCSPDKNAAHNSTFPGTTLPVDSGKNAGFITRSSVAKRSQAHFGYLGAGGIASCSSWGLSVRSRTTLHSGTKAGPTSTIHSQVFVFVLARGGCGRGASALPLNASEARRPPVRALRLLRSEAEQRGQLWSSPQLWG